MTVNNGFTTKLIMIIKNVCGIAIGIIALVKSSSVNGESFYSRYTEHNYYGGDAYTGIQNAAADAANNASDLSGCICAGFSAVLLIAGLILICFCLFKIFEVLSSSIHKNDEIAKETVKEETHIDMFQYAPEKTVQPESETKTEDTE